MYAYGRLTLICIIVFSATGAIAVETNDTVEGAYQEEAFPEDSTEGAVRTADEKLKEDERTDELPPNETSTESQPGNTITQEVDEHETGKEDEELSSGEAFPEESIYDEPIADESIYSVLDKPHEYVSENIEKIITRVDRFFANDALYRYTTDSYVQITADTLLEENGEVGYDVKLRGRVDLPGTKKRFKVIFNTNPSERQDPLERSVDDSPAAAVEESDLFGSIQRERDIRGWKFRPSVGAKISQPVVPFVKAQFTKIYPMRNWALRGDQNFYWFDDDGFGSDTTFDFDRPVGEEHLFRASSFARWTEENEYFNLSQIFTFFHTLSSRRMVSYQIGAYGQTSPTLFMTDYLLVVRYRQLIHKEWLFFEVRPQVQYSKINDWDDEVSLLLRLEMFFGRQYM